MIIVTTDEVAGYEILEVLGETMGAMAYSSYGLGYTSMSGGSDPAYSAMVQGCRNEAMNRLWVEAAERGANAVVGMRYDLGQLSEYLFEACAYGTAVVLRPKADGEPGATPQSARHALQTNGQPGAPSQPPPTRRPRPGQPQQSAPLPGHQPPPMPKPSPAPPPPPPGDWPRPPSDAR